MKKASIILFVLFFGIALKGLSQTTPAADFYAAKWEITIFGTPNGDSKMTTEFIRKDGKLTGELKAVGDDTKPAIPITSIEETPEGITVAFSTSGYDVTLELTKVDEDNLKGSMMGMFDVKAKKLK